MINKIIDLLNNKKIAILGFGREGKSTYNFIRKYLGDVPLTLIDQSNIDTMDLTNVNVIWGDNYLDDLSLYDLVIKTPGISLKDIDTSNINITSQMELLLEVNKKNIIGVTGTKGKSTTTSLIYEILQANNVDSQIAGNIGIPVFDTLEKSNDETIFVLEMSSHQLEFLKVSPHIGIVLNLFEDHLDHAGSIKHYHDIKMNMFKYQSKDDYMIYCSDNETLNNIVLNNHYNGVKYPVNLNDESMESLNNLQKKLLGMHNLENIMVAYKVSEILKLNKDLTLKAISDFNPLPYRLEYVGNVDDVDYYVDTLATIPSATLDAIKAIPNISTLIFGGMDRGISYDGFAQELSKSSIKHFICMPTTGHNIGKLLPKEKTYFVDTLKEACKVAKKITDKNTACILSPAAASYEQFKNYAEKGDKFKEYILGK